MDFCHFRFGVNEFIFCTLHFHNVCFTVRYQTLLPFSIMCVFCVVVVVVGDGGGGGYGGGGGGGGGCVCVCVCVCV